MGALLASKYSVRESHRLGFSASCAKEATVFNRVVRLGVDDGGRRYVDIEPDARHVELIVKTLGLGGSKTKGFSTPNVKVTDEQQVLRERSAKLGPSDATLYRSNVMRASFVAQDRADLGEAVKCLAQGMASPTEVHMGELKRLGRYLLLKPSLALRYRQQTKPTRIKISVDSDLSLIHI